MTVKVLQHSPPPQSLRSIDLGYLEYLEPGIWSAYVHIIGNLNF